MKITICGSMQFEPKMAELSDELQRRGYEVEKPNVVEGHVYEDNLDANAGLKRGFIDEHFAPDEKVILAGNSIHQDRKFIDNEWPRLAERLHYRMLDVSAFKVLFDGKYGKKFAKPEAHRAMEDIRGSIQELTYYTGKIKV